ncbi:hypothetical protein DOTSEDRAFT_72548 [Dothistroma septosporum NZE10]|uniref:Uncharacterized protein n=1 Tax=Dothistroma septosporum (strain NZE10 / CBS 128990) TaxID=675120 RepID=M2YMN3_DOTSN|nr:hypothetical protein DOTSEDRAFT_72548 [Dothistroma septosporum NZE10]
MGGQRICGRPSLEGHFTAHMRTKHTIQHIEHTLKRDSVDNASEQSAKKTTRGTTSHSSTGSKPVDSVMGKSTTASTTSTDSSESQHLVARSSTDSILKAPTQLRSYREEPRLWIDFEHEGGKAGKAIAKWKEGFVPLIHEVTEDMTAHERTELFDKLIVEDTDRYLQPLGTYYTFYPEHIPDRETSEKQQRQIDVGMNDLSPQKAAARRRTFQKYFNGDWSWDPYRLRVEFEPDLGPRDELTPDDELETCQHCISQTRKGKAKKMVRPVMGPFLAIQRRISKSVRLDSHSSEVSREDAYDEGSREGSNDAKPRNVTETGVGMRTPMSGPRSRRRREANAVRG